jgi:DNA-binding NarL/FixJ family response regulator
MERPSSGLSTDHSISVVLCGGSALFRRGIFDYLQDIRPCRLSADLDHLSDLTNVLAPPFPTLLVMEFDAASTTSASVWINHLAFERDTIHSIIIAPYAEGLTLLTAHFAGISACVVREAVDAELPIAVAAALRGETWLSPMLRPVIVDGRDGYRNMRDPGLSQLTISERRILSLIAASRSSAEIANQLNISRRTVDHHRLSICKKLKLSGRYSLLRYALDHREVICGYSGGI